jgi:hypothetical protein
VGTHLSGVATVSTLTVRVPPAMTLFASALPDRHLPPGQTLELGE